MTAHLRMGDCSECIPLRENTVAVGVCYHGANGDNRVELNVNTRFAFAYLVERVAPDGAKIVLHCYTSDDDRILAIMADYRGLNMIEISERNPELELTVTV